MLMVEGQLGLDDGDEALQMRSARWRHQGASDAAQSASVESGCGNGVDGSTIRLTAGSQPGPRLCDQVLEPTH